MENNTFWLVTLKWTAFYLAYQVLTGLIAYLLMDMGSSPEFVTRPTVLMIALPILAFVVLFIMIFQAFREYERRSAQRLTAGQAFGMGLVVALLSNTLSVVGYTFFGPERMDGISGEFYFQALGFQAVLIALITILFIMLIGIWRMYEKAEQPGWGSLVPIYNGVLMLEIARKPGVWLLLLFIPVVNIFIAIMIANGVSKAFGRDETFTIGLVLLPFFFYPILGFGNDRWIYGKDEEAGSLGWQLEDNLVP